MEKDPIPEKECNDCRGSGFVMVRDTGVCGTEEYGTCRVCRGTGKVSSAHRPCHCPTCAPDYRTVEGLY